MVVTKDYSEEQKVAQLDDMTASHTAPQMVV